jgi:membrane-bound ClpP family serine protease
MRRSSVRAYALREATELAIVLAVLAVIDRLTAMPTIIWMVVPPAKVALSLIGYRFLYRTVLLRAPRAGPEALIGTHGQVTHELDPHGRVLIRGERWRATARGGETIPDGRTVEVVAVRGTALEVRRVDAGHADGEDGRP